ncbi:MAG: putative 3-oxoacyl-[acyl-carrier-protein] reductase (modular protein) [Promethearchaeota archaeon]|nr:MAG: putative 3-oxoacyl-[acyl-carrier-protein] reductase (modular protein) [Candidatus Lokiarchaeota archaeon]
MSKYSIKSKLGDLMKSPKARAVLEKYLPGISKDPQLKKGFKMSLKFIAKIPGSGFPKEKLPDIDADLQAIVEDEEELSSTASGDDIESTSSPPSYISTLSSPENPMKRLEGKVVVLTGASAGLGKQISIRLGQEGAKLAICARRVEKLMKTAELCEAEGAEVFAERCDVSVYKDLKKFIDKTVNHFGTIDVLINNANFEADRKLFLDQDIEMLDKAFHTGVYAHWHLMKLCYPHMKGKSSSIINFCSGTYQVGLELYASYAADKGAIRALSMVVAREWGADGIRVNTISPVAITDTIVDKLTPEYSEWVKEQMKDNAMQRVGDPYTDIAPVVVFLASDESRWITGQNINVDGGQRETIHI